MPARPSAPLLAILRETIKKRGLSTAELALRTGLDRGELKKRLAGQGDLTVDEFLLVADALGLAQDAAALSKIGAIPTTDDPTGESPSPIKLHSLRPAAPPTEDEPEPVRSGLDPEGSPARQLLEAGFLFGLDMFIHFDRRQLDDSGVPDSVLNDRRFVELLPVRLEARWHRHNRPEFLADVFRCKLSFDALYTCTFPWRSLRQVGFTIPPEPEPEAPPKIEEAPPTRPMLRLVKD